MTAIRRLYVHCTSALSSLGPSDGLTHPAWLPERALAAAVPGDLVCLPRPVDVDHLTFLNLLGVGPAPDDVLVPDGLAASDGGDSTLATRVCADRSLVERILRAVPPGGVLELHAGASTPDVLALARWLEREGATRVRVLGGSPADSERADQKHVVRAKAIELGVPVAPGEVVELPFAGGRRRRDFDVMRAAIERQLRLTGRVLVRGSVAAGRCSSFVVSDSGGGHPDEVIYHVSAGADNRVYLIEAMVDPIVSPTIHLHIERSGTVSRGAATDRRSGRPPQGVDLFPSSAHLLGAMEQWAHTMASWIGSEGYVGDLGLDFVEYRDEGTGEPAAFLARVNPRIKGAGYSLALRNRLNDERRGRDLPPIEAFASAPLTARLRSFGDLADALGVLLFSHEEGRGIVPCATGLVALAPTTREALALQAEARAALEDTCAVG
ncbi:MAG TPA: hypothetical protein VF046_15375 [Gemmatimonadales bacterium]